MLPIVYRSASPEEYYLADAGKADAVLRMEIVIQMQGSDPPQPTPLKGKFKLGKDRAPIVGQRVTVVCDYSIFSRC